VTAIIIEGVNLGKICQGLPKRLCMVCNLF